MMHDENCLKQLYRHHKFAQTNIRLLDLILICNFAISKFKYAMELIAENR